MRAVRITESGDPEVLRPGEVAAPEPGPDEVLVEVRAAAINRADLYQRRGHYPVPPGWPEEIPGLEMAGVAAEVGNRVRGTEPGDRVMALLGGGGYAEKVCVHGDLLLPVPENLTFVEAAGVPEVFYTAYDALFRQVGLEMGERVLIHAAGGGVGTAALQLAGAGGAGRIFGTASGPKLEGIRELGLPLDEGIDYRSRDFAEVVSEQTGGDGVDVILDVIGGEYWEQNMESLAWQGRMVLVGLLGGRSAEVDLGRVLRNRLTVVGTVLRARSLGEKLELTREFREQVLPLIREGRLRPIVDRTFPLEAASEAHRYMEADRNLGKIVLDLEG